MSHAPENAIIALIVAAGRGRRFADRPRADAPPKQYRRLGREPVLRHVLRAFENHPHVSHIQTVIHPDDGALYAQAADGFEKCLPPVAGGSERQASVLAGLTAVRAMNPASVLVHDAARPHVSAELITRIAQALETAKAVVPVAPVPDTVRLLGDGRTSQTLPRDRLRRVQTPQGFDFRILLEAHEKAARTPGRVFTDDASMVEQAGIEVLCVDGDEKNIKLTVESDLMERLDYRTGSGFDAHRFTQGGHVTLCGVKIPHEQTLEGHSDADVAIHALTDALLGALALGDIGRHFPMSDENNRNRASEDFLRFAVDRAAGLQARIVNIDLTIICEVPKIGPYREEMVSRLAAIMNLDGSQISVKATTTEKMGFTGRAEGIAAQAVASVALPRGAVMTSD